MADFNARVVLSAKNTTAAPMRQLRNDLRGLTDSLRGLGRTTGLRDLQRDFIGLGRTVGDINRRHITPMMRSVASIGGMLGGLTVGAGLAGSIRTLNTARESLDKLGEASRQLGMPVQEMREFAFAAKMQGVEFETAHAGLKAAAKSYADIQDGLGKVLPRLKAINPVLGEQLKASTSAREGLDLMMSAIHRAGTEAEKIQLSQLFFGTEEFTKIAEATAQQFRAHMEEFRKLGGIIRDEEVDRIADLNDEVDKLTTAMGGIRDAVAVELLPDLTPVFRQWTAILADDGSRKALVKDIADTARAIGSVFEGFSLSAFNAELRNTADGFKDIAETLGPVIKFLQNPMRAGDAARKAIIDEVVTPFRADGKQSGESREQSMDNWLDGPPLPRRARGGPLSAGQLSIVGEEGPELFRPNAAGTVFTASQTRAMMRQQMGDTRSISGLARVLTPLTDAIEDLTDALKPVKLASLGSASGLGGTTGAGTSFSSVRDAIRSGTIALPGGVGGRNGVGGTRAGGNLGGASGEILSTLRADGFSDAQAFALLGHMQQESNLNPGAWNSNEAAGGLLQWRGNRLANLKSFAASRGTDWQDRKIQASFVKHEMDNDPYERKRSAGFREATSIEGASAALRDYVRFGDNSAGARLGFARRFAQESAASAGASGRSGGLANLVPGYSGKDVTDFLKSKAPGKDASHLTGLDPVFAGRLAAMIKDAPDGVSIFSGYRSPERQQELWQNAVRKYGSEGAARKWVAPPGKSLHNSGSAADLGFGGGAFNSMPADVRKWLHANAPTYGLKFPLGHEPWHIEKQETRGGEAFTDPRGKFARNLRPNMNRKSFTPATRDHGYRAAEVPASKVEIGKGSMDIRLSLPDGVGVSNIGVKQPENLTANVGVDRTGAFRPASGTKTGMRGPG